MKKVFYNRDNFNRCLCGGCPVNRSSQCVTEQETALKPYVDSIQKDNRMPDSKIMSGIYCSVGKSTCSDLNKNRSCLCPACSVELTEGLKNNYYCLKGNAVEVG